ncbi:MAG: hypothetical protein FJ077_02980 [Cyanobacteria bacterium K_DeepCast_35m_m2_023]|nr:hypothetical protein [Cyanobacteria bacterium K_DeepCast_35m_m2_023]
MATRVVVVFKQRDQLERLQQKLAASEPPLARLIAIGAEATALEAVDELNPATMRRQRQRQMALWLVPFGFLAGLTFTYITDLDTFAIAGAWSQHLLGGVAGMISGWMGSFAAAASVSSDQDDRIRGLRNRVDEGNWLLLAETLPGIDMPWTALQQARPVAVVRLNDG